MYKHCRAADNSTAMINLRHNSPVPHYGCNGQPNQGIELPIIRVAKNILQKEKQMRDSGLISSSTRIHPGPADTNIFTDDGRSSSHASEMAQQGVPLGPRRQVAWLAKNGRGNTARPANRFSEIPDGRSRHLYLRQLPRLDPMCSGSAAQSRRSR
jgi:hypothetical protein